MSFVMISFVKEKIKKHRESPWLYFGISFLLTWLFLLPAVGLDVKFGSSLVTTLIILSGILGKVVPPILLTYLGYGKKGLQDYWERLVDWKRISFGWWLATFLLPILGTGLGVVTAAVVIGSEFPGFSITDPLQILLAAVFIFVYGPLVEELGWTGYQLDRLQAKYSALGTGIILGFFWMLWHLPMFFIEGSYQQEVVGFNTPYFWFCFVVGIICLQILQVWIYNNSNRSIMSGVMIHFAINFSGEMLELSTIHQYFRTLWIVLFTGAVVVIWGPKSLTKQKKAPNFKKILREGLTN